MIKFLKKIFCYKAEIKKLKNEIESLKFDIQKISSIVEKYFPLMKAKDKIQFLILRRCLWTKK